jgi:hypothetical protein
MPLFETVVVSDRHKQYSTELILTDLEGPGAPLR